MCLAAGQGLKIDSMNGSEKFFFYEVKQRKRNTVTGDPRRNPTRVARMAGDTHLPAKTAVLRFWPKQSFTKRMPLGLEAKDS